MMRALKSTRVRDRRGAALLTVLIAMMIITLILFEFQYNSMVERKLAYNDLNQTQAYYLAKSGARLGILRIALYGRLRKSPQLKALAGAAGNITPFLDQIWQLPLPPFPPQGGNLSKLNKADKDAAEKSLSQTKIKDGTYSHSIRSEGSKINLNFLVLPEAELKSGKPVNLRQPPTQLYEYTAQMLLNVLDGFIRESDRPYDEYPDLHPEELVLDIMDWVNPGDSRFGGGAKDAFYETQKPPYKAKRNRFYTLEELRLVRGIDEKIYSKLKPFVTVYSYDGKININGASSQVLRSLYRDFTDDDLKKIMEEKARLGGSWPSEKVFHDYITTTLGRSGFGTLYKDPNNYPFTIGSQSFLIESIGMIEKSKSSVQRVIRVAVALTNSQSQGGQALPNVTDPTKCAANPDYFWDLRDSKCRTKPSSAAECQYIGATWMQDPTGRYGCKINNQPILFPNNAGTTPAAKQDPNAVKILYWSEV